MIKKCLGCGSVLQSNDTTKEGYIADLNKDLCERCFRIKNYGDYQSIVKDNDTFMSILQSINKTQDLVVLVVDLINIPRDIDVINKYLLCDQILVLTKRDLLPKSVYDNNLIKYIQGNYCNKIIISSEKNYHFDELLDMINLHKKSKNVYVVGYTNAGKSTMINKLIYNYSDLHQEITTSILPSTTLGTIEIKLNDDLTIIDTPGLLTEGSMINYVEPATLKRIMPKDTIRPITYHIKADQFFTIDGLLKLDCPDNNSLTFYFSNQLEINRVFREPIFNQDFKKHIVEVEDNQDVVIEGLGFIKVVKKTTLVLYTIDQVAVYTREALI